MHASFIYLNSSDSFENLKTILKLIRNTSPICCLLKKIFLTKVCIITSLKKSLFVSSETFTKNKITDAITQKGFS